MNICFIGYGNMAKAIAKGLTNNDSIKIHACAPSLTDGEQIDKVYTHKDNNAVISDMDIVILAVKPHQIKSVLPRLKLSNNSILVSIAAGVTLEQLSLLSPKHQPIVRSMPNTPLAVGYGATQLIGNSYCTSRHKELVNPLFSESGIYIWLDDESLLDAYTGLSGSGPAYIFYILESMVEGAKKLGINPENARQYAEQTMLGALKLSQESKLPHQTLREQVTSPGGATAEAIQVFERYHLKDTFAKAMAASCNKAKQLKETAQ